MTPSQESSRNLLKRSFVDIESDNDVDQLRQKLIRTMNCQGQTLPPSIPPKIFDDQLTLSSRRDGYSERDSPSCHSEASVPENTFYAHVWTPIEHTPFRITPEASVLDLAKTSRDAALSENHHVPYRSALLGAERLESLLKGDKALDCIDQPSFSSDDAQQPPCSTALLNRISLSERRSYLTEHKRRKSIWIAFAALLLVLYLGFPLSASNSAVDPDSVYVSGGGFSGFWFSIGRLQSVENPASKNYYCYSAGCLAVVAALSNSTLEQMSDLSFSVQKRWQTGETKHHGVVTDFLDNLVETPNVQRLLRNEELLAKIHIITAVKDGWYGLKSAIRSPTGLDDLYTMLLQTTWIPFATGEQIWEVNGSPDGEHHMDGIFSSHDHPVCAHHVGLPWNWDLRVNALNVNLGADKVAKFWAEGLVYGL